MATIYRLDFSGTVFGSNEGYSGYAIIDYSTPNSSNSPSVGDYDNAITEFELNIGSTTHALDQDTETSTRVINNDVNFGIDSFSISFLLIDTADDSEVGQFFLRLIDPTMAAFSGIELPTSLSIADFDLATDQTGVLLVNVSTDYFHPIDFVQVTPVPLPAGMLLLLSGVSTFFAIGYRRRSH